MHYGFNLSLDRTHLPVSKAVVDAHKNNVKKKVVNLKSYLMADGNSIDAELIAEHLFPEVSCDVFISHSFNDQDLAIQLAHELQKKGVQAFVDSVVWGSSYDLLRVINDKYSKASSGSGYDYECANRSAAHVHMVLAGALQRMIMQSSTLMFLNTDRSISTKKSVQGQNMTHSPWIHMELMFSHMLWKLSRGDGMYDSAMESIASSVPVFHTAPVEHLQSVSSSRFVNWLKARPNSLDARDFNSAISQFHANPNRAYYIG
ncbi:toll/interleukin-1 receptor domain-containing protein [Pseudomonas putida]|uniref:toll/interleukin-1 receptor domain-containing protein n=1 Tax=Pseudomonas putida TaxID=303 RepID=UPI0018AC569A|nr:toll/interleukin-1 receptor domain-containing protein [Pseudomonas putida]MBF8766204.1 toll/interleukin-1 receptor domain-containing protein [Pseudomonas putida]